ncbi:MAG: branched-chain amino acid ABC transporter permease [Rhodobacterales bacterium 65-51]|uniref:Branched-chain amino acid ABC transporter permease n=1 Tax=Gemmobacter nanjingensis TaxID=488454 RepID=A0ABQ3FFB3_9RHOB|nr:branched-chain amino acid ABC transporter permease [Gemmobacter nanjingensis]OJY31785.1 MAG: branched-chain amino acid ABC transporter permease [Rhodobacterales bacterium 65-51]GHC21197.1 branched-chain amino acid ABC transporter permease [Gemmobacter nanjingensis]
MFYREAGDFKTSYVDDSQTFPIRFDRMRYYAVLVLGFGILPFVMNDYWANAVFVPFLIYAIAAIGLNILTGYCGQVSLGTGGFMAVGAYACYKLMTAFPWMPMPVNVLLAGLVTAGVGVLFGLPSLRIKGFYLAVATLAAQFFLVWLFNKVPWFYNYSASGQITAPERTLLGVAVTGASTPAWAKYLFCAVFLFVLAWLARNLTRGTVGRKWMAIRDMDIAAEIIGVNPLTTKLSAFAVSSFYIGIAGALFFAVYLGAAEVGEAFGIQKSFLILFMVIIGGLGSIFGSFAGAAFLVLLPVLLKNVLVGGLGWPTDLAAHIELMIVGALIIVFLILEPHGLAQLWRVAKEKLRLWPFPH